MDFIKSDEMLLILNKFANEIFTSLVEHFQISGFEDPKANHQFITLLSLLVEEKVEVKLTEEGRSSWALTEEYKRQLEEELKVVTSPNVIRGPW